MNDELKPCPFCGGEATIFQIPQNTTAEYVQHPKWTWFYSGLFTIGCETDGCMANYNNVAMLFVNPQSAINAWNRRING
jgi:hypothetical protein